MRLPLPSTLAELNAMTIELLRGMDREAAPLDDNYPTGLWWYAGHLDRKGVGRKKQNSELCWTHRLRQLLNDGGVSRGPRNNIPTVRDVAAMWSRNWVSQSPSG